MMSPAVACEEPEPCADEMPADVRDRALALSYWLRRGVRPRWADRVFADRLAGCSDAELRATVLRLARRVQALEHARGRGATS